VKPLCLLGCLLFIIAAIGNGIDRQAKYSPSLAAKVPDLLAADALAVRGEASLNSGQIQTALDDGTYAVLRAPIDPASSALLGSARLGLGDTAGAQRAMLVAGAMGWRVPLTQIYWMQQAAALQQYPVAAFRLDALLRQHPWMLSRTALLAPLESNPEGRKAIADRLATMPPWLVAYARETSELPAEVVAERAAVLSQLSARGQRVGCDPIAPLVNRLVDAAMFTEAHNLWQGHCREAGSGLIGDSDLAHIKTTGARSYFEWDMVGNADVSLALVSGDAAGQMVEVHSEAKFERTIMRQLLTAPPGRYRLEWRAASLAGKSYPQVVAAVGCSPDPANRLTAVKAAGHDLWQAELSIGSECPAHWLAFSVLAGSPDLRLGGIKLVPIH
jgi:hypothetical protein